MITGLLNLLIARKSQVDAWAESNPRWAALFKLFRSLGIDPWMFIQSLALFFSGKLPKSVKSEPEKKPNIPPLGPALALLAALSIVGSSGCSQGFSWPKVVESCAPAPADLIKEITSILVSDSGELNENALKELENLGRKHSGEAVLCVVSSLVEEWTGKVGVSKDESNGARRGQEFLKRVGSNLKVEK